MLLRSVPIRVLRPTTTCGGPAVSTFSRFAHSDNLRQPPRSQAVNKNAQDVLKRPLRSAFGSVGRFFKIGFFTFAGIAVTTLSAFEGYDRYIEWVRLSPPPVDAEAERWEWENEQVRWNGDAHKGGTDSGMPWRARHQVRAASIAHLLPHMVVDPSSPHTGIVNPHAAVNTGYFHAAGLLEEAIALAEPSEAAGKLHPETFSLLLKRHASYLEKLGPQALPQCKTQYERAWIRDGDPFVAWRLGEVSNRLGHKEDAVLWWSRAIHKAQGLNPLDDSTLRLPTTGTFPSSPSLQRTLTSALVSLSSFYASNHQLAEASRIQKDTLSLLRSLPHAESSQDVSHPEALHTSTIVQRASVLSLQHAEVLFAQGRKPEECIGWLQSAAESSTRVLRILSETQELGLALSKPYTDSPYLRTSAQAVFRDARRTTSEAWNLMGILGEQVKPSDPRHVLNCYQEALKWAAKVDQEGKMVADVIRQAHWQNIIASRDRAQQLVDNPSLSPARRRWFGL